ncbi:biotin carboxylase [Ralstonia solanacearum]|uniref:Biotin carboxylase n=1 Tax=Ralstonia solanacearum TaxID=305 RepID=A0AAW5ZUN0_RALSL|nr:biotin carboxylase [Ralstonia solanacearum]MDB0573626.1 biotin carboxylase [Ralstonia solanacearum]
MNDRTAPTLTSTSTDSPAPARIAPAMLRAQRVAILYQALPPPVIDGIRKNAKPGGYADSGADIAHCLRDAGFDLLTPHAAPDPARALDWVFPDTEDGIAQAIGRGATMLWANTVLFRGHPIERRADAAWIVGQAPALQQDADDKFATNARLRRHGLPVAASALIGREACGSLPPLQALREDDLHRAGLAFPLVIKPVRGRGSEGVTLVHDLPSMQRAAAGLLDSGAFGDALIAETFLAGEELTVTVLPRQDDLPAAFSSDTASALPPVRRFNHVDGVAPYNGAVAVTRNSVALSVEAAMAPEARALIRACLLAYDVVGARAPIRIDCRADAHGAYQLFDLNMKPNMTGAGRPGREDQDSLSALAARAVGWDYRELLVRMMGAAWRGPGSGGG